MTVLKEGAAMAQLGWMMGGMTAVFLAMMTAWIIWVYWPSRRPHYDAVARLPFDDEER